MKHHLYIIRMSVLQLFNYLFLIDHRRTFELVNLVTVEALPGHLDNHIVLTFFSSLLQFQQRVANISYI